MSIQMTRIMLCVKQRFCNSSQAESRLLANSILPLLEKTMAASKADRGVLVCGTGLGMSIAANKVKGAYAALLSDVYSAQRSVLSNNANIACMGAFTIGGKLAEELLKTFLGLSFDPSSSSAPKVARYHAYDEAR